MRIVNVENMRKIKKAVPLIEEKIKIKVSFGKDRIILKGNELNEFLVEEIVRAIDFGFDKEDALLLKNDDFVLEFINVKEHTRRKNLKDVRARLIGKKGKAKKTMEKLTGSSIVIKDNIVGVIVDNENLDATIQAVELLIQGSKHGNVFSYLEKQNSLRKAGNDLGLRRKIS